MPTHSSFLPKIGLVGGLIILLGFATLPEPMQHPSSCIDTVEQIEFANKPFGLPQVKMRKSFLVDTLLKGVMRSECRMIRHTTDTEYSLQFYQGSSSYTFVSGQETENFFLKTADIEDSGVSLKAQVHGQDIGVGFTQSFFEEKVGLAAGRSCDTVHVTNDNQTSSHIFYFTEGIITKIHIYHQ